MTVAADDALPPVAEPREPREPKYYVVKRHLLDLIAALPPGSAVPTERVLTTQLSTSRTTVRQALAELVGEGRLIRRQGAGTFVAEPKISWPLLRLRGFTEQAEASGLTPGTRLLDVARVRADDDLAPRLGVRRGAAVHRIERLRLVDGTPMALETSHLAAARFPGLVAKLRRVGSLYRVLEDDYGVRPATADESIETAVASPHEAGLLGTDIGTPMLLLSRHSVDADGTPVEWVRSWYRGDRYRFVTTLGAR